LIAVSCRNLKHGRIQGWETAAIALPRGYVDALTRAGALVALLPSVDSKAEPNAPSDTGVDSASAIEVLAPFDGLLLTGGADVDPSLYGQEPHPKVYGTDPELDRFELALVDAALAREMPILAICRGHQLLNVALGGTLDQHITDRPGVLAHGDPSRGPGGGIDHEVTIEPDTKLAHALGTTRCSVRSHHHQAVDELAAKATVTARADDGVLEGFELAEGWVVAVQWHPESTAANDPVQQRLFGAFVEAC
jgi:putative glutamine amidotransferase